MGCKWSIWALLGESWFCRSQTTTNYWLQSAWQSNRCLHIHIRLLVTRCRLIRNTWNWRSPFWTAMSGKLAQWRGCWRKCTRIWIRQGLWRFLGKCCSGFWPLLCQLSNVCCFGGMVIFANSWKLTTRWHVFVVLKFWIFRRDESLIVLGKGLILYAVLFWEGLRNHTQR